MTTISLNIIYWKNEIDDRASNAQLAYSQLRHFSGSLEIESKLEISVHFFDFSEICEFGDEVIHIPFPKAEFYKTAKINRIIQHLKAENPDFVAIMDADIVIRESDYDFLRTYMKEFRRDRFYVCEVENLINNDCVDFETGQIAFENTKIEKRQRNMMADLGGLYFAPYDTLAKNEIFDERFEVWGGEDNAASFKLQALGLKSTPLFIRPLHLNHKSIESDSMATEQYRKQLEYLSEYQNLLPLDGINTSIDLNTLTKIIRQCEPGLNKLQFVDTNFNLIQADHDIDTKKFALSQLIEFFGFEFLSDLKKHAGCDVDLRALLALKLQLGSLLNQKTAQILQNSGLQLGAPFEAGKLFGLIATIYGSRRQAAEQAFMFIHWLGILGLFSCIDHEKHIYQWDARQTVPVDSGEDFIIYYWVHFGKPPLIPITALEDLDFYDLSVVLNAVETGKYTKISRRRLQDKDYLVVE